MSLLQQLNALREKRKTALDGAGKLLTTAHADNERTLNAEEETEFNKRHTEGDEILAKIQKLEKQLDAEASLRNIREDGRSAGLEDVRREDEEGDAEAAYKRHLETYCAFVRGGPDALSDEQRNELREVRKELPDNVRAMSSLTGASGAYTIPNAPIQAVTIATKAFGGIIDAADYINTDAGNLLPWPTMNDTSNTGEVTAENALVAGANGSTAPAEVDPTWGIVNFYAYMVDSGIIRLPVQLMEDTSFSPEKWVNEVLDTRVKRKLNTLATTGNGASTLTGLLTVATVGVTTASATALTYNELLTLEHSVDPSYRMNASFMFHDQTLLAIKKLVDSNGRPLFIAGGVSQGIQGSSPDTINGYSYWINQDFPQIAGLAKSVAFGDFKNFKIRKVKTGITVRFGERFMDQFQVGFLVGQRYDSNLVDAGMHPIQIMQQHS